ncbi:MAG: hypothetical protein JXA10_00705 [Anaerolineae bacterium]|nr:hypothetical protein [Anaerolineae bacterium]
MNGLARLGAAVAYVPVIGWVYAYAFQRTNTLVIYHLRQSIGLVLFLIGSLVGWAIMAWLLAWLPYLGIFGMALFTLVITAYLVGIILWVIGIINALNGQMAPLPGIGRRAEHLFSSRF